MTTFINLVRGSDTVYKRTSKIYPLTDPKEIKLDNINPEVLESMAFKHVEEDLIALA